VGEGSGARSGSERLRMPRSFSAALTKRSRFISAIEGFSPFAKGISVRKTASFGRSLRCTLLSCAVVAALAAIPLGHTRAPLVAQTSADVSSIFPALTVAEIDSALDRHLMAGHLPGAVVLVGHGGSVVLHKAYGKRSLEPEKEEMTIDTVFDLASLTKVVATAPAVMLLAEQGKLKLDERVSRYVPAFGQRGKKNITIQQLLVHYSGLPAELRLPKRRKISAKNLLARIYRAKLVAVPGDRFIYSDLGFIVLGKLVEAVSHQTLDRFAREQFFAPLKMTSTGFLPAAVDTPRIAPTERRKGGGMIRGQVHDPLASSLGGVAGDAGLFSTAEDLSRFCQMLLGGGSANGVQILKPSTVLKMTSVQSPEDTPNLRGLGWDIQSAYSSVKGSFFSSRSYGHTGYTGTSLWIDPETETFLILLTNRVHPHGGGNVKELRTELADTVGRSVMPPRIQLTETENYP
jgi:CubicO group peptidase (beta-lactamase class C family)